MYFIVLFTRVGFRVSIPFAEEALQKTGPPRLLRFLQGNLFFVCVLAVDLIHGFGLGQFDVVGFGPIDATGKNFCQENAQSLGKLCTGFFGKLDFLFDAVGRIHDGLDVDGLGLDGFGIRFLLSCNPKVFAAAVAIVDGQRWESRGFNTFEDGFMKFFLPKDLVDAENEVSAEFGIGRNTCVKFLKIPNRSKFCPIVFFCISWDFCKSFLRLFGLQRGGVHILLIGMI